MILLTVKTNDLRGKTLVEGEFDKAWYRLSNEDTNQTLDYKNIKKIDIPEGFEEEVPADDDDDVDENAPKKRNELVYLAGRLFLDKNGRWVYEGYNVCFNSAEYPNVAKKMAQLYQKSISEDEYYKT